jgi:hypothetical protein
MSIHSLIVATMALMALSSFFSNSNGVQALPQFSSQLRRYAQAPIQVGENGDFAYNFIEKLQI